MYCDSCGYFEQDGCCEDWVGHTVDGQCVTVEFLEAAGQDEVDRVLL
jgi:hypothetical protein